MLTRDRAESLMLVRDWAESLMLARGMAESQSNFSEGQA